MEIGGACARPQPAMRIPRPTCWPHRQPPDWSGNSGHGATLTLTSRTASLPARRRCRSSLPTSARRWPTTRRATLWSAGSCSTASRCSRCGRRGPRVRAHAHTRTRVQARVHACVRLRCTLPCHTHANLCTAVRRPCPALTLPPRPPPTTHLVPAGVYRAAWLCRLGLCPVPAQRKHADDHGAGGVLPSFHS